MLILLLSSLFLKAEVTLGLKAGLSAAQLRSTTSGFSGTANTLYFIQPGLMFDISLDDNLFFRPSLNYLKTGYIEKNADLKLAIHNINIPLNLCGKFNLGPGKFLVFGGPVGTIGVSGSVTEISSGQSQNLTFNDDDEMRRATLGLNLGIGYAIDKNVEIQTDYQIGLSSLTSDTDFKIKTNIFGLNLVIFLNNKN